jgi:hypothetical protein
MQAVQCIEAGTSHLHIDKVLRGFAPFEKGIHPVLGIIYHHWSVSDMKNIINQIGLNVFFNVWQARKLVYLIHSRIGIVQI